LISRFSIRPLFIAESIRPISGDVFVKVVAVKQGHLIFLDFQVQHVIVSRID
jgi:hypothetical protein